MEALFHVTIKYISILKCQVINKVWPWDTFQEVWLKCHLNKYLNDNFPFKEETGAQLILGIMKRWVYESINLDTFIGNIDLWVKVKLYILSVF